MIPDPSSPIHTHQWKYNGVVNAMFCRCGDRIDCDYRLPDALADDRARLAQLEQEQATLRRDMCILACAYCDNIIEFESPEARWTAEGRAKAIDHLLACPNRPELALIEKLETAEAALGETRQALHQLIEKLDVVLPIVDGYIAMTHIRSGGQYEGPNLIEEIKHAKALLSRVAQTGVPREDSVPQGRSRGDTTDSAEGA